MQRFFSRNFRNVAYSYNIEGIRFCSVATEAGPASTSHNQDNHDSETSPTEKKAADQFDVAVVGGGMVGLALAGALSKAPLAKHLRIAIVDSNPYLLREPVINNEFPDPRVSTLTPATISFFKDIGAWDFIRSHRHAFFNKMQVWDYTGLGYTRYRATDVGCDALGCVVENKVIQAALLSSLQNSSIEKTIFPANLTSMVVSSKAKSAEDDTSTSHQTRDLTHDDNLELQERGSFAKLQLSNEEVIYAKLVVGADGSKSRVRDVAGFKTSGWNYSQDALICTVEHGSENETAWQRFLPTGPLALLPIGDRFSNIVWTMTPNEASHRKSISHDDFLKVVNGALSNEYGPRPSSSILGINLEQFSSFGLRMEYSTESFQDPPQILKLVTDRLSFPLSLMHSHGYVSNRIALIGDAAHTVHPLAGQGVNLGFGDAEVLSQVISEGIHVGTNIGEVSLLQRYEKERKLANLTMMAVLDGFQKAFSIDNGPWNVLRAIAFHGANHVGPLKRSIISYAMGEKKLPLYF